MSSAHRVTHNFVNGTVSDADAVDQNFSDLVNIINSHAVHKGETALEAKTRLRRGPSSSACARPRGRRSTWARSRVTSGTPPVIDHSTVLDGDSPPTSVVCTSAGT